MGRPANQQSVLQLLENLRGLEPLKELVWKELNYERINEPVSRRDWNETAARPLADNPVLFAGDATIAARSGIDDVQMDTGLRMSFRQAVCGLRLQRCTRK
jgi:hypothetical protein